jgi:hypothetical protein
MWITTRHYWIYLGTTRLMVQRRKNGRPLFSF